MMKLFFITFRQLVIFFSLLLVLTSCNGIDCSKINENFSSYNEAINTIEEANFKIEESINTSKSSWIKSADFYSCDGADGYFVLKTADQDYLYSGVPAEIWQGFKNADSFGRYYNRNIKHKFIFKIN